MADPNFAPFDPADLDPSLPPAERVKRGFEATRVIDRTAPGYPGAFLYSGQVFDPAQHRFLGVPMDTGGTSSIWRTGPSYSQKLADKLGSRDLDNLANAQAIAVAKRMLGH